ncbi:MULTISPECIES: methyl-accepting chemotaxis protein [Thalassospira]|uniref:Methyl-accepting chemotaxis protein n=1 Tax=Thalassospira aquimaris TaxID=3037796 RepID=A0ABT6GE99_9PROT|nr:MULTISPECIES: methyl-accepting chemotaxis protein [Thalassospira]MDG4720273.1 methyl-accepting chemotaxis protein [Thalassospira sp. FZY0004]
MINLFSLSNLRLVLAGCWCLGFLTIASVLVWPEFLTLGVVGFAGLLTICCVSGALTVYRQQHILDELCDTVLAAAAGNMDARISNRQSRGKLANMQNAVNQLLDLTEAFTKEAAAAMNCASRGDYYRKIVPRGLRGDLIGYAEKVNNALDIMDVQTKTFRSSAGRIGDDLKFVVGDLSDSARKLTSNSDFLSQNVTKIADQSSEMRRAAEESSAALDGIATATEQFSGSIKQIGSQIDGSASLSEVAVERARSAGEHMERLDSLATSVTSVVKLITDVAEQTNLLALNATIEAARAGEAGKGFAVVASEVKNLANQSSHAAEEVIREIGQMQEMTREAVVFVHEISETITEIDNGARLVADATREQTDAVAEISNRIEQAVTRMRDIVTSVALVASGTNDSREVLVALHDEANGLLGRAESLDGDVRNFIGQVLDNRAKEAVS